MTLDNKGVLVRCGSCRTTNRLQFAGLERATRCAKCHADLPHPSEPIDIESTEAFDAVVAHSSVPVIVDFWAAWCGPCRTAAPEVGRTAASMAGRALVLKVDTERHPDLAARFGVSSIPNFVVLKGGLVVRQQAGVAPHAVLMRWLEDAHT